MNNRTAELYRMIWRWHFYAGLFCIPFVMLLSITGTIYLYKPQFENWIDRDVNQIANIRDRKPPSQQVAAAMNAFPGSLHSFEFAPTSQGADRIEIRQASKVVRVFVHPSTLEVLRSHLPTERFMNVVKKLHGELMIGDIGSAIVELVACWTLVMVFTGLFLWWPRKDRKLSGVLYPRLKSSGKIFLRDLHAVVGLWISLGIILLIVTGLPWTSFWGEYFRWGRNQLGLVTEKQDWSTRHGGHEEHASSVPTDSGSMLEQLDRVALNMVDYPLKPPVIVRPPAKNSQVWTVRSMTPNRPLRETILIDGATGHVLNHEVFLDRHPVDRAVGIGIALHEGQLFGLPNQILATLVTCGLMGLSLTGMTLWLRRRESPGIGAPKTWGVNPLPKPLLFAIVVLGLTMPLFGGSLILVAFFEFGCRRFCRPLARWLSLADGADRIPSGDQITGGKL